MRAGALAIFILRLGRVRSTFRARRGRFRVIRVGLTLYRRLPLYPHKQTLLPSVGMSQKCQIEKNSVRVYVFRFALELGHCSTQSACLKRATCGRNSIENLSPTTDVEISSSSIFGSIATDTSAATHSLFISWRTRSTTLCSLPIS